MLTVYSKNNCAFCNQAKALLETRGYKEGTDFQMVKIDEVAEARDFLLSEGHRTVPQIYQDGKLFVSGGFQGLAKMSVEDLKQRMGQDATAE